MHVCARVRVCVFGSSKETADTILMDLRDLGACAPFL